MLPLAGAAVLFLIARSPPGRRTATRVGRTDVSSGLLRGVGLVYLIAFTSLRVQVRGLYGQRGIAPLRQRMERMAGAPGAPGRAWRHLLAARPTLLWIDASDRGLVRLCTVGQLCAAALMAGWAPKLSAGGAWAAHVSFVTVGSPFLDYQWDALLNEAGLIAVIAAPPRWRLAPGWSMPRLPRWLFRFLTFRLHFESGLAKLASGDRTWRRCTACAYHHETQPLPTPLACQARRLPAWVHRLTTAAVLLLETAVPFLVFGPKGARRQALALLEGLQAGIALTGNFAYFNLLTGILTLSLREPPGPTRTPRRPARRRTLVRRILAAVDTLIGTLLGGLAAAELLERVRPGARRWWRPLFRLQSLASSIRGVSSYGLFAHMTRARPEIVIEGSDDGHHWRAFELPYKPGDPRRPPRWVAPHQPRLDWQMWFAALSPLPPPWFEGLLRRLLEGSPEVLALFEVNPFPEAPPRYVRALLYQYRMIDRPRRASQDPWWDRELVGLYFPPARLGR